MLGYQNGTVEIINKLIDISKMGVQNYANYANDWLISDDHHIDCEEKKKILPRLFEKSSVALIYGSAGTGKSTLINHISRIFSNKRKVFLAQTNPAVDNLFRKVESKTTDTKFTTIAKFISGENCQIIGDIIIIVECSTVSNFDMIKILERANFKVYILVGDTFQNSSIKFGNWFSIAQKFLPDFSVFELKKPYRSNNSNLQTLWEKVRTMDDSILDYIAKKQFSTLLDNTIFDSTKNDEIILCLNYDGLYGINNINRLLQENNTNNPVEWGIHTYNVGDPILFNDCERFNPVIYNNIKGKIIDIKLTENKIEFTIEVCKSINGLEIPLNSFELLTCNEPGKSIIKFSVTDVKNVNSKYSTYDLSVVPFQVAYAISIHKAQGLEYESVKLVITDEVDERITHNIFYTAITRARTNLKIYWSPEVSNKVVSGLKLRNDAKAIEFLKKLINNKPN